MKNEYLIKLLEEYLDPNNQMDSSNMVKIVRSTNRSTEAQMLLDSLKAEQTTELKVEDYCSTYISSITWFSKGYGAVFVDKEENIKAVYDALVAQDDYWKTDSGINENIKVFPVNATISYIRSNLEYTETDIYDGALLIKELREKGIEIFIYSEYKYED